MPKKKKRKKIPPKVEKEILIKNDHRCCICHKGPLDAEDVQIHHINGDRSDNRLENLAVLCGKCHNIVETRSPRSKSYKPDELKAKKTEWENAVTEKRKHLSFPPAIMKEKVIEKVDEKGRITERAIEREISYANGLAPQALNIIPSVLLSPDKELIIEEVKRIISSQLSSDKLLSIFNEIKQTPEIKIDDLVVLSRICLSIGDSKFGTRDYSLAEIFYKQALDYARSAKESEIIEICLYEIGASVGMQGRHKEALVYFEDVIEINKTNPAAWFNKGVALSFLKKYKAAIYACNKAIDFGKKVENWGTVAIACYNMGHAQGELEKHKEAVDSYVKAIDYGKKASDWGTVASAYYNMGNAQGELEKRKDAVDSYVKAIYYGKKSEEWGTVASAYYNMGNAQEKLDKHKEAVDSYLKAIDFGKKISNWGTVASAYSNMGYAQGNLEKYKEAVDSYLKAINYGKKASDWGTVTSAYSSMGYAQVKLEKHKEAVDSCVKAIDHGEKAEEWGAVASAYYHMGYALVKLEKHKEAVDSYMKAIDLHEFLPDKGKLIFATITLVICSLGTKYTQEENQNQAKELAVTLAKVYSNGQKDGMSKSIVNTMEDFKSNLSEEDKCAFQKFEKLFEKAKRKRRHNRQD